MDLLEGKPQTPASDIVSGSLDADKLDYMLRDSYHIGVYYGRFDLECSTHYANAQTLLYALMSEARPLWKTTDLDDICYTRRYTTTTLG